MFSSTFGGVKIDFDLFGFNFGGVKIDSRAFGIDFIMFG
jgi:hypothetical protein